MGARLCIPLRVSMREGEDAPGRFERAESKKDETKERGGRKRRRKMEAVNGRNDGERRAAPRYRCW